MKALKEITELIDNERITASRLDDTDLEKRLYEIQMKVFAYADEAQQSKPTSKTAEELGDYTNRLFQEYQDETGTNAFTGSFGEFSDWLVNKTFKGSQSREWVSVEDANILLNTLEKIGASNFEEAGELAMDALTQYRYATTKAPKQ